MDAKYLKKAFLSLKASLVEVISSPVYSLIVIDSRFLRKHFWGEEILESTFLSLKWMMIKD